MRIGKKMGAFPMLTPVKFMSGNEVDIEALAWLAEQKGPRLWLVTAKPACGGRVSRLGYPKAGREIAPYITATAKKFVGRNGGRRGRLVAGWTWWRRYLPTRKTKRFSDKSFEKTRNIRLKKQQTEVELMKMTS